jgi:hypothetical protein
LLGSRSFAFGKIPWLIEAQSARSDRSIFSVRPRNLSILIAAAVIASTSVGNVSAELIETAGERRSFPLWPLPVGAALGTIFANVRADFCLSD